MVTGSILDIFFQWENLGVFDYLLPFLLIFALVYGILSWTRFMGDNKPVYIIIALVIGLMSLRYQGFLSSFMSELFPQLGIGLSVLLTVLILVGLFIASDERRYWGYGLGAIGVIIAIVVIYNSFDVFGYVGGYSSNVIAYIVLFVIIVAVIVAVGIGDRPSSRERSGGTSYFPWSIPVDKKGQPITPIS